MSLLEHETEVARRFDEVRSRFKDFVGAADLRLAAVREALGGFSGKRVLDLGCGKGRFGRAMAAEGAKVVGVDSAAGMIAAAEGFECIVGSAVRLPLARASFQAVVAIEVLEHVANPALALDEARRVLEPGGVIVIVDKNALSLNAKRPWLPNAAVSAIDHVRGLGMYPLGSPVCERWFVPSVLESSLRARFEDVERRHLLWPDEVALGCVSPLRVGSAYGGLVGSKTVESLMTRLHCAPPELPVLLWKTPPGLELALAQEGLPHRALSAMESDQLDRGRFVLFDSKSTRRSEIASVSKGRHVLVDVAALREPGRDPFAMLVDLRSARVAWNVGGQVVDERTARYAKGRIRRELLSKLRATIEQAGGVWARVAPMPYPYRSAFNFRVDLDEPIPEDYFEFAKSRKPIEDCTSYYISTNAYGNSTEVLADLSGRDVQSHGHYHASLASVQGNVSNLSRAREILRSAGFASMGFAAPGGRWTPGLDLALEQLGYEFSSDFGIGYDDLPYFPWLGKRFSRVLQIPIHPVCEGLLFEAGCADVERRLIAHFESVIESLKGSDEPIFLYGHPERRLARLKNVPRALDEAVGGDALVWRTTADEFARWWRWRANRGFSLARRDGGTFELAFENWDSTREFAVEFFRGSHSASVPATRGRMTVRLEKLAYVRKLSIRTDSQEPPFVGLGGSAGRSSRLDWETAFPVEELPAKTLAEKAKKSARKLHRLIKSKS